MTVVQADPDLVAPGRFGLRTQEYATIRRLLAANGVLYIVNMFANLIGLATDMPVRHREIFLLLVVAYIAAGLGQIALAAFAPPTFVCRWYPEVAWVLFGPGVLLVLATFRLIGLDYIALCSVVLAIFAFMAFYLMRTWVAVTFALGVSLAWVGLVAVTPHVTAPITTAIWIPWGITAFGIVDGIILAEVDRAREREQHARAELAAVNMTLESRVASQVEAISRLEELKRFLPHAVADAIVSTGNEQTLAAHRREIAVLFIDLRGFTAFTAAVEPEEVIKVLSAYYEAAGAEFTRFGATVGSFAGDGIFAYLGDPHPVEDPAARIIDLALAIAARIDALEARWRHDGYDLSYGIGLAMGHATLGSVGYDERRDYTALGTVVNRGARLCGAATGKQTLVDQRIHTLAHGAYALTAIEPLSLKGFSQPITAYEVAR